jgi:hypothetical protein
MPGRVNRANGFVKEGVLGSVPGEESMYNTW